MIVLCERAKGLGFSKYRSERDVEWTGVQKRG